MTFQKPVFIKFFSLFALIFIFFTHTALSRTYPYQQIVITPALAVREAPDVNSKVLTRKFRGDRLVVYSHRKIVSTVNGMRGHWLEVDDGYLGKKYTQKGWVFSGFLGNYREGPDTLYRHALSLEKKEPAKAIDTYRQIIRKYPKARELISADCRGTYSEYADNRIKIISCSKKQVVQLSMKQIEQDLIESIRGDNYSFLESISPCQVSFDDGRLLWGISPQNISKYLDFNDINTDQITRNPASIFFESKNGTQRYYFLFTQKEHGYILSALGYDR